MKATSILPWKYMALIIAIPVFFYLSGCSEDDTVDPECTVGATCDDGNPITVNDVYDANCDCEGTAICTVGAVCDDGDPLTVNDVYNTNCACEGETAFGSFTDPRNGQNYQTIIIGTQTWMAENLNYESGVSWCFNENSVNCTTYGRLYDWETALNVCPAGWHLPSSGEWTMLTDYLGGENGAGGKMKESGMAHWNTPNTDATNVCGFTGLPGGTRLTNGDFIYIGDGGYWWSSEEDHADYPFARELWYGNGDVTSWWLHKGNGMSVRCLED